MASFLGEFECRLDNKSRFMMPAALRKQLDPESNEQFVMNRGFEGCLVLYPQTAWDRITDKLKKLNLFVAQNRAFYRQFHNGATAVVLDRTGRVLVPKALLKYGALEKEVVLFAYADRIEIWSKANYIKVMTQDVDAFATLAEEVMGSMNPDE